MAYVLYKKILVLLIFTLFFNFIAFSEQEYSYNLQNTNLLVFEATDYADFLYNYNLFQGKDGGYKLEDEVTRAEAITVLVRLLGKTPTDIESVFTDVPEYHWANPYIAYAKKEGLINGINEHEFAPDRNVTGLEFTKMSMSILGYDEVTIENAVELGKMCGMLSNEYFITSASDYVLKRNDLVIYMLAILNSQNSKGITQKEIIANERSVDYEKFNSEIGEAYKDAVFLSDFCCSTIMSLDYMSGIHLWYFCIDKTGSYSVAEGLIDIDKYTYKRDGKSYIDILPSDNLCPEEYFFHIKKQGKVKLTKEQLKNVKGLLSEVLLDRPYNLTYMMHDPEIYSNINGKKYSSPAYLSKDSKRINFDLVCLQNRLIGLSPVMVEGSSIPNWTGFKGGYKSGELLNHFQISQCEDYFD